MVLSSRLKRTTGVFSSRGRRATRCLAGVVVAASSLLSTAIPAVATTPPTLVVLAGIEGLTSARASLTSPPCSTATARTLIDQHHLNGFLLPPAQVLWPVHEPRQ